MGDSKIVISAGLRVCFGLSSSLQPRALTTEALSQKARPAV